MMVPYRIGLLGLGQIGSGFYKIVSRKKKSLESKTGVSLSITAVAVNNSRKKRNLKIPASKLCFDAHKMVQRADVDCVVELIGGTGIARKLVLEALENGKDVVTANKALIAEHGQEISRVAAKHGAHVFFEASVGGGIPVIRALQQGLVGNHIEAVYGIINGTCNYILTRMSKDGLQFKEALALAQKGGYAEPDPSFDIGGIDSAHKLTILASLAADAPIPFKKVSCEGIEQIDHEDIEYARQLGYVIKLLAIAKQTPKGISARVHPALLARDHILAKVDGAYNAILFHGDEVGDVLLYGKGAGECPTASAVLSDVVDSALKKSYTKSPWISGKKMQVLSSDLEENCFYIRLSVLDRPKVLATVAGILGRFGVSIAKCIQLDETKPGRVPLILITHKAPEKNIRMAVRQIRSLKFIKSSPHVFRIEE